MTASSWRRCFGLSSSGWDIVTALCRQLGLGCQRRAIWRCRGINSNIGGSSVRRDAMADSPRAQLTKFIRGIGVRQLRLGCGLVLFAYLVSHFLNHALGNVSMDALAAGVWYHTAFWQFLPVTIVFYTAALVHAGLGIWALYDRRQFRWKAIEPLQL